MDSTPSDQIITLRSPFNGEVIKIAASAMAPGMLEAMLNAKYIRLDTPKQTTKPKHKETTDGEIE